MKMDLQESYSSPLNMKITPNNTPFAVYSRLTLFADFQRQMKYETEFGGKSTNVVFSPLKELRNNG